MNQHTRLQTTFDLEFADRPPILGGWLAAPGHIQTLTGCSGDEYWSDIVHWGLEAERILGSDGVISIVKPASRNTYRIIDEQDLENRAKYSLESVLAEIEALPDPEEIRTSFDEEPAYAQFLKEFKAMQTRCGDILWCPADWKMIPKALWYHEYGYENALILPMLYPTQHLKLMRVSAEQGRQRAILRAHAIREGFHPRAILTGEDLCSQQGPMISPKFLRQDYFSLLEYTLEPLLAAGARIVWHCDGDCRPILPDVLACGLTGLQGFQQECGMDLEWIVNQRTRRGEPLLIFGPMSVTTTLPHGRPDDVRTEVQKAIELCRDKASLVFFTSNTILPDVPLENILAFWEAVCSSRWYT